MGRHKGQHTAAIPTGSATKYHQLSEEQRKALIKRVSEISVAQQEESLKYVERRYDVWTPNEDAVILENLEMPLHDLAILVGRTFYATRARWQRLMHVLEEGGQMVYPAEREMSTPKAEAPACACATFDGEHEDWCPQYS